MAKVELSIDLGSKFITICQNGIGPILREPSVAIITKDRNKLVIQEAGYKAQNAMIGAFGGVKVVTPIREGIVVDEDMAAMMLKYFLDKVVKTGVFAPSIRAMVLINSSSTAADRRSAERCCLKAGIKEVTLVETPLALLAYTRSVGGLIVDMGGGKTEISAVTNRGIAAGCTVNIGGDAFNKAIIDSIQARTNVRIGENTIEALKLSALTFYNNDNGQYSVSGNEYGGSKQKTLTVKASDMTAAVLPLVDDVIEVVVSVLNETPSELAGEILRKGIFVTGGCMNIPKITDYIASELQLPVTKINDYEHAAALGGLNFFNNRQMLSDMIGVRL